MNQCILPYPILSLVMLEKTPPHLSRAWYTPTLCSYTFLPSFIIIIFFKKIWCSSKSYSFVITAVLGSHSNHTRALPCYQLKDSRRGPTQLSSQTERVSHKIRHLYIINNLLSVPTPFFFFNCRTSYHNSPSKKKNHLRSLGNDISSTHQLNHIPRQQTIIDQQNNT